MMAPYQWRRRLPQKLGNIVSSLKFHSPLAQTRPQRAPLVGLASWFGQSLLSGVTRLTRTGASAAFPSGRFSLKRVVRSASSMAGHAAPDLAAAALSLPETLLTRRTSAKTASARSNSFPPAPPRYLLVTHTHHTLMSSCRTKHTLIHRYKMS